MILSHRIELKPNKEQKQALSRACGVARYTWNWALEQCQLQYQENKTFPNLMELKKRWNKEKPCWVLESPRDANSRQFFFLQKALKAFFAGRKKGGRQFGFPKFKSKHTSKDSFYLANDQFWVKGGVVKLPVIGKVRLTEELRFEGKIVSGTVSRENDKWFLSVSVEGDFQLPRLSDSIIAIDMGIKHLVTLSDGQVIDAPKPLKRYEKRLKHYQRVLSRRVKGSKNREKAKHLLAKIHSKVSSIRKDFIHKLTTNLCRESQAIIIEDLNVGVMVRNHHLAKALSDVSLGEIRRQLLYKVQRYDGSLVIIDRWYPSSKTCSCCGNIKQTLKLSDRQYHCGVCGLTLDRDLNAARNLRTLGLRGINARGDLSAGCPVRDNETRVVEAGTSMYAVVCA